VANSGKRKTIAALMITHKKTIDSSIVIQNDFCHKFVTKQTLRLPLPPSTPSSTATDIKVIHVWSIYAS
jgi:hypothetical protein